MNIKIVNLSKHPLPSYEAGSSAGMDLRASLERHEKAEWIQVEELEETERGAGGFEHTGTK